MVVGANKYLPEYLGMRNDQYFEEEYKAKYFSPLRLGNDMKFGGACRAGFTPAQNENRTDNREG